MKYLLEPLLKVRRFREDAAANAMVAQRRKVAAAEEELARRRGELAEYVVWRAAREEELWRSVIGRTVANADLDDLKLDLRILQAGHNERQEAVFGAEKSLEEERARLVEAVDAHRRALRSREKLDLHRGLWKDERARAIEYAAELELEDFRVRKPALAA
jgi:type III secretion protein O